MDSPYNWITALAGLKQYGASSDGKVERVSRQKEISGMNQDIENQAK